MIMERIEYILYVSQYTIISKKSQQNVHLQLKPTSKYAMFYPVIIIKKIESSAIGWRGTRPIHIFFIDHHHAVKVHHS